MRTIHSIKQEQLNEALDFVKKYLLIQKEKNQEL
mgnify:CR=1 FL=1